MKWENLINRIFSSLFLVFLCGMAVIFLVSPKAKYSIAERRHLQDMPELTWEGIKDASYMQDLESYLLEHFPFREAFRGMKAFFVYDILLQKENNDIYVVNGHAAKLEYPMNETSIMKAAEKMSALQEKYFSNADVYYAIVPDKNYFLAKENGYPSLDYENLEALMQENLDGMTYIPIWDTLTVEDYYTTDTHWRQEHLGETVERLAEYMGFSDYVMTEFEQREIPDFYGVYYGQSALALPAESMYYLTNEVIDAATHFNVETNQTKPLYELDLLEDEALMDKYNIYLGGAVAIQTITSPKAAGDGRLIIFRDSFTSSLAPLLTNAYQEIVLIDTRYVSAGFLGNFVDFTDADVLFLYNPLVLNNSTMLKN
ncbi:MAG: hypothetical protein E7290_06525 [Lachnospiraceae bacterium]|nr:hypothetical protein [Lachnospiraceae bacterium]